jgi:hypothetical protein
LALVIVSMAALACGRSGWGAQVMPRCEDSGILALACEDDSACHEQTVSFEAEPPRVLLVLDRSCSMQPRWSTAVSALREVVERRGNDAAWGLSLFPDREFDACTQGELLTPIREGAAAGISQRLFDSLDPQDPAYPSGPCPTNLVSALWQASGAFGDEPAQRVVLLITDGWDTCEGEDASAESVQLLEQMRTDKGISTYVISFPSDVSTQSLEAFAVAGGTAREGDTAYYPTNGDDLSGIVDQIVGGLRCNYTMQVDPLDLPYLQVSIDGGPRVPRDPVDGWTYDEQLDRLSFHGLSCDQLQGSSMQLDFSLQC